MAFFGILWLDILILISVTACLLVIYKFIVYLIKRAAKTGKIPMDVVNGLKLFVRLVIVIAIIILIITFTELPPEVTLAISAIIGTIIGFASIQGIQNFVSGVYIIITRPFGINDLIAIGDLEGVVTEISLNYTKIISAAGKRILVANRNILNSNIINYTRTSKIMPEAERSALGFVKHILIGREINQYSFSLELPLNNPRKTKKTLEEIINAWESKLGYKPTFKLWNLGARATFRFTLTADDPSTILKNRALFIEEIYKKIYTKK